MDNSLELNRADDGTEGLYTPPSSPVVTPISHPVQVGTATPPPMVSVLSPPSQPPLDPALLTPSQQPLDPRWQRSMTLLVNSALHERFQEEEDESVHSLGDMERRVQEMFIEAQSEGTYKNEGELLRALEQKVDNVLQNIEKDKPVTEEEYKLTRMVAARHVAKRLEETGERLPSIFDPEPEPLPVPRLETYSEVDEDDFGLDEFRLGENPTGPPKDNHVETTWRAAQSLQQENTSRGEIQRRVRCHYFFSLVVAYWIPALFFVLFVVGMYRWKPLKSCTAGCRCTFKEGMQFMFTYSLLLNIPRCLFFALYCEVLVYARREAPVTSTRPVWDVPTVPYLLKRRSVWILTLVSVVLYVAVLGPTSASEIPGAGLKLLAIVCMVAPFAAYCLYMKRAQVAALAVLLQIIPTLFELFLPGLPFADLWPILLVIMLERIVVYFMHFTLELGRTPFAMKVATAHIASFYAQSLVVVGALHMNPEKKTGLSILYFVIVLLVECLFSTLVVENACARIWAACRKAPMQPIGSTDFRTVSTQTRQLTLIAALLCMIPTLAIQRWPSRLLVATEKCREGNEEFSVFWISFFVMWLCVALSYVITSCFRSYFGRLGLPLALIAAPWALVAALYLASLSIEASVYLLEL